MSDQPRLRCQPRIRAAEEDCSGLTPEQWMIIRDILRITEREKCYTAPIQEETPKTVAMEVSTVIASWRSFFQMVFFIIVLLN